LSITLEISIMKYTITVAAAFGFLGIVNALPKSSSKYPQSSVNDGFILNYALTLEHLEDTFYRTGLKKFTKKDFAKAGFDASFYENLLEVAYDERTHVAFLTGALKAAGVKPVEECTYNFGFTSPESFIATAAVLEGVGVSAYLGAAASIANKAYLTAAGSILTVEARHSAYIRGGLKEAPFPQPFDAPLDFKDVYTLAAPFIKSCPADSPSLSLSPFPSLSLCSTNPSPVMTKSTIKLVVDKHVITKWKSSKLYACFVTVTGPICSEVKVAADDMSVSTHVPAGVYGQSYVLLTTSHDSVSDDTVVAGPAIVEIAGTAGGN